MVSVIIPARNEAHNIRACLQAIADQETSVPLEVIVVDSGSSDGTVGIVREFMCADTCNYELLLTEIPAEEFGHGKTRNLGAAMARGDVLVFLNADALPDGDLWLASMLRVLNRDAEVAGVFSRHLPKPGCFLYMARDLATAFPERSFLRRSVDRFDFMIFSTVSCAVRRDVWERFPFKDDILIAEDQEWARRVLAAGYGIDYEPASRVFHSHNYTPAQLFDIKYRVGMSETRFTDRFSVVFDGFISASAGFLIKFAGDLNFIFFKHPGPLYGKCKETAIACRARFSSFRGRFKGWRHIGKKT